MANRKMKNGPDYLTCPSCGQQTSSGFHYYTIELNLFTCTDCCQAVSRKGHLKMDVWTKVDRGVMKSYPLGSSGDDENETWQPCLDFTSAWLESLDDTPPHVIKSKKSKKKRKSKSQSSSVVKTKKKRETKPKRHKNKDLITDFPALAVELGVIDHVPFEAFGIDTTGPITMDRLCAELAVAQHEVRQCRKMVSKVCKMTMKLSETVDKIINNEKIINNNK